MNKNESRLKRAKRSRLKMKELGVDRLVINRTPKHIYAQIVQAGTGKVLAAASSLDKELKGELKYTGNAESATSVGALIGKRGVEAGVKKLAFDRGGFKYHGRVKALADAAREAGLEF